MSGSQSAHVLPVKRSQPACEICGCTEDAACGPFGCAWDPIYRAKGRLVCTSPRCLWTARTRDKRRRLGDRGAVE